MFSVDCVFVALGCLNIFIRFVLHALNWRGSPFPFDRLLTALNAFVLGCGQHLTFPFAGLGQCFGNDWLFGLELDVFHEELGDG